MKTPNVSPQLKLLKEEGLIQLIESSGRHDFWTKKPIDRTLRISQYLCKEYNLSPDGRPKSKNRSKKKRWESFPGHNPEK